jgi:hypothetical protein
MSPRIFTYTGDHFTEVKTSLSNLYGWWQTVAVTDVNGDGKQDLILGNIGDNFYLQPDAAHPVKLWVNDFDKNGIIDKILTRTVNARDAPVYLKRELSDQLPILKKQNLQHADYAKKAVQDLFPEEVMKTATVKIFNYDKSCVAINKGNGNFEIQPLPGDVQFSCINAIDCEDVNGDGYTDLVLGGNKFEFQPQFCQLDASFGYVLLNDRNGKFRSLSPAESGVEIRGEIRDIKSIESKGKNYVLFLVNNEYPVLYAANRSTGITGKNIVHK